MGRLHLKTNPDGSFELEEQPEAPSNVFALATPHHFLLKLHWEIEQLKIALKTEHKIAWTDAPAYHAFNCAVTCWHLSDWVWEYADENLRQLIGSQLATKLAKLEDFQAAIRTKHRSLHVCWQIANGSKHMKMRKSDPNIKTQEVWKYHAPMAGSFQAGQPLGRYEYQLSFTDQGQTRDALATFEAAEKAWTHELQAWFIIEGQYIGPENESLA